MSKTPLAHQVKYLFFRKNLLQSRQANGEPLSRREANEMRLAISDLHKFKILSTCLIPGGNMLLAPIYFNPRRFWPTIVWDCRNHVKYIEQDNMEKIVLQDELRSSELLKSFVTSVSQSLNNPSKLRALKQEAFSGSIPKALESFPREHLEKLSACHGLCTFTLLYSWSPTSMLVKWLAARGQELAQDDRLLLSESLEGGGVAALSASEVVDACQRRGILPHGVYAQLVLKTGTQEEEQEGEGDEIISEADITRMLKGNWDVEALRHKLLEWVTVSEQSGCAGDSDGVSALYVHASALGLFVKK